METMWKYSRQDANLHRRLIEATKKQQQTATTTETFPQTAIASSTLQLKDIIVRELSSVELTKFSSMVDTIYENAFKRHYSSFTATPDTLLYPTEIPRLYECMKSQFPFTHVLISQIVSTRESAIVLSDLFTDPSSINEPMQKTDEEEPIELRERCILEYFIALLRVKSQRQLRYWAMLVPLAFHSKGFMQPGKKSYTNAHHCTLKTAWHNLGKLFKACAAERLYCILNESTVSGAFDNWQCSVAKTYQQAGKSSIFQRATAMFLKKNKSFEIPIGSKMTSPSGVEFRVVTCDKVDNYGFLITGSVDNPPTKEVITDTITSEIDRIHAGAVLWPDTGWHITAINGVDQFQPVEYVDQYIPAPIRARVPIGATLDDILFGDVEFTTVEDAESRVFTTDEYHELILRQNRFQHLHNIYYSMKNMHSYDGDEVVHDVIGDCVHDDLPRNYQKEAAFVEAMDKCSAALDSIKKFQSRVIKHVNPTARDRDLFIHFPLYKRDETSNEGMTMVSATVHENCGLIRKSGNDDFVLQENATHRKVFMHGDGLTVSNYKRLEYKVARRSTEIGREDYVSTHLTALRRVMMQKGLFHELMHHAEAIYKLYYGGFLQAMQAHNAVKKVTGEPSKNHYQQHDKFLDLCKTSCSRLQYRMCILNISLDNLSMKESETQRQYLLQLETHAKNFVTLYQQSPHEPSRVASLFVKQDECYQRQRGAMRKCDSWLAEKEACELVIIWKACGKTTYYRQQCEYIEHYYSPDFLIEDREFMRRNGFCVLSDRERGTAFDECCELYNADIKETKLSADLSVNVDRSRHVMLSRGCAEVVFDRSPTSKSLKSSREDDVVWLEQFLFKSNLFQGHDAEAMHDKYFWDYVESPKSVGTARDKSKEEIPLSEFELKLKENLCTSSEASNAADDSFIVQYDDDDTNSVNSVASSCAGDEVRDRIDLEKDGESGESDVQEDDDNGKIGNLCKQAFNRQALVDYHSAAKKAAVKKTIKKQRETALYRHRREMELIDMAVSFLKVKMTERREFLKKCVQNSNDGKYERPLLAFEEKYRRLRARRSKD
jgi:hypothetical protein